LGRSLATSLRQRNWRIHSVVTRSQTTARRAVRSIGGGHAHAQITRGVFAAPIILIAVPDSSITAVVAELAAFGPEELRKRVVLHTSGALSSGVLDPLRSAGAAVGSFHPLQSFSGVGTTSLEGRLVVIEGDAGAVRFSRSLARMLGGHAVLLKPWSKPAYHAAASIAAGQALALLESAVQIFTAIGMKRKEALNALVPLTRQVLENQERLGSRAAWTGPLARGDYDVIAAHEKALRSFPGEYLQAYRAVNRLAARVLAGNPEEVLASLERSSQDTVQNSNARGVHA
jgi:predicted short-subunit dehydrogenase-like oxidoreductase (DUF2520 family)